MQSSDRLGPSGSFTELLGQVETEFFAFCDQDDVWAPHKLSWAVEALDGTAPETDLVAYVSDAEVVDADLTPISASAMTSDGMTSSPTIGNLLVNNVAIGATMVGSRRLAETARDLIDPAVAMHDWWCALTASAHGWLLVDPVPTMRWRRHPAAVTAAAPRSLRGRLARRRAYVADAATMARTLLADGLPMSPRTRGPLEAMAAVDASQLRVRDYFALRRAGVRGATLRADLTLLCACADPSTHVRHSLGARVTSS